MPIYRGLVLGYYHKRNAGDDYLAACMERWLHDHDLTFLNHTERPPAALLARADYVILGGGSILDGNHGALKDLTRWSAAHRIPIFVVGASICNDPTPLLDELRQLGEQGPRIWLRDERSRQALGNAPGTTVAPDLTWLFPFETVGPVGGRDSIDLLLNLRPWHRAPIDEKAWHRLLREYPKATPWPLCFGKDADATTLGRVFPPHQIAQSFDPSAPSRAQLTVAMRFHALIFSIQSGTPILAITNTKKVTALLEELDLDWATLPANASPSEFTDLAERAIATLTPERLKAISQNQQSLAAKVAEDFKANIEIAAAERRTQRSRPLARVRNHVHRKLANLSL